MRRILQNRGNSPQDANRRRKSQPGRNVGDEQFESGCGVACARQISKTARDERNHPNLSADQRMHGGGNREGGSRRQSSSCDQQAKAAKRKRNRQTGRLEAVKPDEAGKAQ